jgi:predicted dehydrogenase
VSEPSGSRPGALGFALAGCGEIALRNARAIAASGAGPLLWAVDPNRALAEDLARRHAARASDSLAEALADPRVGAVIVAAPHDLHAPVALEALQAGRHVLVEKPLARTADEARRIASVARERGVALQAFYALRFYPETVAARRLLGEGTLGEVHAVTLSEHLTKEMPYWFGGSSGRSRSSWRASRERSGGGVLLMNLCHHLDRLVHLTGRRVEWVSCETASRNVPGDVEDVVAAILRLEGGAIVSLDASTSAPGGGEASIVLRAEHGRIALDPPPRFLALRRNPFGPTNAWCALPTGDEVTARGRFIRAFADEAMGPRAAGSQGLQDALHVQEILDACYASAETRRPVEIPAGAAADTDARTPARA